MNGEFRIPLCAISLKESGLTALPRPQKQNSFVPGSVGEDVQQGHHGLLVITFNTLLTGFYLTSCHEIGELGEHGAGFLNVGAKAFKRQLKISFL